MTATTATQWPLSAAATDVLVRLPSLHAPKQDLSAPDLLKLAIKELLIRRAMDVRVEKRALRKQRVYAEFRPVHGPLPVPLGTVDSALRGPLGSGDELSRIVKNARKRQPGLQAQVLAETLEYLADGGLAVRQQEKRFGIFTTERWRRTQLGDSWAESANAHRDALITELPGLTAAQPGQAAQLAAASGALILFAPGALLLVARLYDWLHRPDSIHHAATVDAYGFDFIDGVGDAFDAIAGGMDGAVDAVAGAVDSVIDSVGSSIDGAIDSAVDSGGGGCGSGGDSGGSDGGGGGCGGGCGGGGGD